MPVISKLFSLQPKWHPSEKLEGERSCSAFSNWHEAAAPQTVKKTFSPRNWIPKKHLKAKEDIQTLMHKYRPIVSPCYLKFCNRLDIKEPKYISRAEFFEWISIDPLSFGGNRSLYLTHIKTFAVTPDRDRSDSSRSHSTYILMSH
jgi:hypothetical protein